MKKLILLLFVFTIFKTKSQTPESLLEKVQQNYTAEKIYVHYDKANYIAGETIWFKAYVMDGFLPSTKSTVLCVELINDSGKTVQKKIVSINGSTAVGEFELLKTTVQGRYTIKAFTRNLMNFGFERYYYHALNIYNPTSISDIVKEENFASIHFLPEGGNIIGNINNTIAFKCTDQFGYPINIEGKVNDATGKELLKFKSSFNGMGKFEFIPNPGEKYIAECILSTGEKKNVPLPIAIFDGISLNVFKKNGKMVFKIDASNNFKENLTPSYLLGVQENAVSFKSSFQSNGKIINGEIPFEQLPTGILQLTVFNKENKPLAERLVFINSDDYKPNGRFVAPIVSLAARAKNLYSFNIDDTIAGSFSVAVTEFDTDTKNEDNIVSRFLLTADIKGYVHNPAYYFEKNDTIHQQHLDLVMLTNGWRRYSWNEMFSNNFPSMAFKDPDYISAMGKIYDPATGKVVSNAELTVIVKTKDKKSDLFITDTDNEGNIKLSSLNFEDTATFIFQSSVTKNRKVNTALSTSNLSSIFYSIKTAVPQTYFELPNQNLKARIIAGYNFNKLTKFTGVLLDEVKISAKVKSEREKYEKKYVSGRMGSVATREIDFISEPTTSNANIFDYLRSRLNGVNITGGPLDYSINYRNTRSLIGGPIQMNVFLDEFQVDPGQIATLRVQDIAMVKVFSNGGLSGGAGGSLAIYTKKGDGAFSNNTIEHKVHQIEGFTPTKEFFSPNYAVIDDNYIKIDERTTLYWNPFLITTSEKKPINFSFYNSDKAKKFKVVIQGFLEDGKLLHLEKIIE